MQTYTTSSLGKSGVANNETFSLCRALFQNTPIKWFAYGRFDRSREFSMVMSDPNVYNFCLTKQCILPHYIHGDYEDIPRGAYFANLLTSKNKREETFYKTMDDQFSLDNFFRVFKKTENYCDIFTFATETNQDDMQNFYLNYKVSLDDYIMMVSPILQDIIKNNAVDSFHVSQKNQKSTRFRRMQGKFIEYNL